VFWAAGLEQKNSRLAAASSRQTAQSGYPIVWSGHGAAAVEWSVSDAVVRRSSIVNPPGPTGHCVRPSRFIRAQMFPASYNSPRYIATFPWSFLEDRVERCIRSSYHFDRLYLKDITLLYSCLFVYADTLLLLQMLYSLFFLSSCYLTFRLQKCRFHIWLCCLAYKISHQPFKMSNDKINWIERMTLAMNITIKAGRGCELFMMLISYLGNDLG